MKEPRFEEVIEYFKNAKEVKCLNTGIIVDLEEINIPRKLHYWSSAYWINYTEESMLRDLKVWSEEKGYADIISYKEAPKTQQTQQTQQEFTVSFETVGGVSVVLKGCNMDNMNTIVKQIK